MSFSSYFLPQFCWGGGKREWLAGHLVARQGQLPTLPPPPPIIGNKPHQWENIQSSNSIAQCPLLQLSVSREHGHVCWITARSSLCLYHLEENPNSKLWGGVRGRIFFTRIFFSRWNTSQLQKGNIFEQIYCCKSPVLSAMLWLCFF